MLKGISKQIEEQMNVCRTFISINLSNNNEGVEQEGENEEAGPGGDT